MSLPTSRTNVSGPTPIQWIGAFAILILAIVLASSFWQTCLSSRLLASNFFSPATWAELTGAKATAGELPDQAMIGFTSISLPLTLLLLATWIGGSLTLARWTQRPLSRQLVRWGIWGSTWWCLLDVWEWVWIVAGLVGWSSLSEVLTATPQFWLAFCLSGAVTTWCCLASSSSPFRESLPQDRKRISASRWALIACGIYVAVFTTMNWRLYFNLQIPHGDSAMYEEHLWNVLHGKGFRSYLDQGLFFGEHIQFVHLFLIPLYILFPSHLLLELAESTALACGAVPVFRMMKRQTGSDGAALAAAVAYLLYAPMQFLDIEIDLKTFRPEAFGIPLLLLTLDQLERRNLRGFLLGIAFTVTVKEDYAIIFGPLGLWILGHEFLSRGVSSATDHSRRENTERRAWIMAGMAVSVGSVLYLWLATRIVMPWFRSGAEVHYASYFQKFGANPEQIVYTMITNPGLLLSELVSTTTILYALAMLAPVAFLPLFSPGRLAVGAPLFGILCLNELARDPRHHFHAPLVAIVFWATAGGFPRAQLLLESLAARWGAARESTRNSVPIGLPTFLWCSALTTGVFFSLGPLGISFWDPGSSWNWQKLYGPSRRAEMFARVLPLIPPTSRVASTDFVHPRFTHHDRSYDYSGYRRKVSGYEDRVPDDTDFIVIDTRHRYSTIKQPGDIPEYRDHPDQWDLLPDETEGYFIVLKRRK